MTINDKRLNMVYEQEENGEEDIEVGQLGKILASSLEQGSGGTDR